MCQPASVDAMVPVLCAGEAEAEEEEAIDPYELMTPVDILSKIPKDFWEKIVSTYTNHL